MFICVGVYNYSSPKTVVLQSTLPNKKSTQMWTGSTSCIEKANASHPLDGMATLVLLITADFTPLN